ncbi:MAG: oligosaccharide flippase family protein [Bergeyella sp.]
MSQLKKGAILSYITIILTNVIGLVLTPFIIRSLGDAEYGLYTLIGAFVGYISVMDLGLNNTIIRYVSKYRAEKDKKGEEEFLGTSLIIYFFISILVLLAGLVFYWNIETIFNQSLTESELGKAKIMMLILIFNLMFSLPGGSFTAICNAYEKFVFPRVLNIVKYIFRSILVVVILLYGADSIGLVILDTVINILAILIAYIYTKRKLNVKYRFRRNNSNSITEIFSYSIWVFVFAIAYQFQWFAGQTILGITANTITVAIYGVGILLGGYYGAFAGAINTLLLPKATKMSVISDSPTEYTNEMIKIGNIMIFILFLILSGFFLFGKEFITLWVGSVYLQAWDISMSIMLVMTLPLVQFFGNSVLEAKKKNKFKAIVSLITLFIAVIIGYFASLKYGMYGVIIPICSAVFLNSILMSFYYNKIFEFQILRFFQTVFLRPIILSAVLILCFKFLLKYYSLNSWLELLMGIFVFSAVYFALNYFFVFTKTTKQIIFKNIR